MLVILIAAALCFYAVDAYSITLKPKAKQCFIVEAVAGTSCSGSFEVISGDALAIAVKVTDPKHGLQFESRLIEGQDEKDLSEGSFSFDAELDGDYTMCIGNGNDGEDTVVAFNFRAMPTSGTMDYQYVGLESELMELREGLSSLKDHQSYMSQREDIHKDSLDSINVKVLCWTILEAVILIGMAVWQISYIRGFFETKRRL